MQQGLLGVQPDELDTRADRRRRASAWLLLAALLGVNLTAMAWLASSTLDHPAQSG